uniref:Uncharacterized protein n=1 Tax=Populus trichocarpa TaxID=3694 RepID=A0A3N7FYL7_POPTR
MGLKAIFSSSLRLQGQVKGLSPTFRRRSYMDAR